MNLKRMITNQAMKRKSYCLILILLIMLCVVRVFYVNAAEVYLGKDMEKELYENDSIPASTFGTSQTSRQMQDKLRIRMANEDSILAVQGKTSTYSLSQKEYNILTRIVEAEAGNLDKKSKILVANVILNRINHEEFPDTVEEVVFQNVNGAVQFSPVADGRYYTVKVTEATKESVDRALAGEDYSEGALYFMERTMSAASNVNWFDNCLTKLFKYQRHEFYK